MHHHLAWPHTRPALCTYSASQYLVDSQFPSTSVIQPRKYTSHIECTCMHAWIHNVGFTASKSTHTSILQTGARHSAPPNTRIDDRISNDSNYKISSYWHLKRNLYVCMHAYVHALTLHFCGGSCEAENSRTPCTSQDNIYAWNRYMHVSYICKTHTNMQACIHAYAHSYTSWSMHAYMYILSPSPSHLLTSNTCMHTYTCTCTL